MNPEISDLVFVYFCTGRHEQTARGMVSKLGKEACSETGLNVCEIVRLFGALQSNGFASGIYLHPAMTNHSCRYDRAKLLRISHLG